MALDLAAIERAETARVELVHPVTKAPTGCFLTLVGPGSEGHEEAAERLRKRRLALIRRYKKDEEIPNEATFQSFVDFLADVTVNIEGLEKDGQPVAYSRKVAVELFSDRKHFGPEFAAQAAAELGDLANFFRA